MEAFVYCWTDHKNQKLYVGVHKGQPDDGYICSSKPMKKEYKIRPHDFTRQIIACGTVKDCWKLEERILSSVNAAINEDFYNQHNSNGKWICSGHTQESIEKTRKKNVGRKRSEETKQKMRDARAKQIISEETKQKMKISAKLRSQKPEEINRLKKIAKLGVKGWKTKRIFTEEWKERLSIASKRDWLRRKTSHA
jgi:hypothetical protein